MAATVSFATTYVCSPMSSAIRARTSAAGELALGTLLADGVGRAIVLAQPARHTTPAAHAASTLSIRTILPVGIAALTAVGVDVIGLDDYEAEDIIASLIPKVEGPVEIWSGDRDLFSQVRDKDVVVLYPEKGGLAVVDEAEVKKRYGIPGTAYSDFAILRGDPSDERPAEAEGVPKKAAALVKRYNPVSLMREVG